CNNENFEIDTDYCLISNSSPIERFSLNSLSSKLSIENKPNSSSSSLESFPDKIPNPLSYSSVNPPYCSISSTVESNSDARSEEHTSELKSRFDLVCRLLL